ncbi:lipoprotein insertase outer membrane protein LolB [Gammaproteobacteria bacterium]|nr:lipoprotein insertase outer membrane protein LolB [Gammaproteobacteria bacterium]
MRSKNNSGSASLIWSELPGQRNLRLLGPVGGGLILLQQDSTGVRLQDSKGKTWYAVDAADLIYRVTGWNIPVSALRWWLLGMTEPGSNANYTLDDSQRLVAVIQDGWKVTLDKYKMFDRYELPSSLIVESRSGKEDENYMRVKLIVKDWNFALKDSR